MLRRGELLGIYPEGTRTPDGRLYKGKTGVARMALEAGCPVIPVAMIDTDKAQPTGTKVPNIMRVGVRIGNPLDFSRYEGMEGDRFVLRSITDEIMYALMELSGQEYVDIYATSMKEIARRRRRTSPPDRPAEAGDLAPAELEQTPPASTRTTRRASAPRRVAPPARASRGGRAEPMGAAQGDAGERDSLVLKAFDAVRVFRWLPWYAAVWPGSGTRTWPARRAARSSASAPGVDRVLPVWHRRVLQIHAVELVLACARCTPPEARPPGQLTRGHDHPGVWPGEPVVAIAVRPRGARWPLAALVVARPGRRSVASTRPSEQHRAGRAARSCSATGPTSPAWSTRS